MILVRHKKVLFLRVLVFLQTRSRTFADFTVIKLFVSYVPEIVTLSGKPGRSDASYTVFIMCIFVKIRAHVCF